MTRFTAIASAFVPASLMLCACSENKPVESTPTSLFPKDFQSVGYTRVRECRAPGEHSALGAFTVWINASAVSAFAELWATPPARSAMPAGSIVVKELYADTQCVTASIAGWVAMKKEPAFDPAHGDWHWQELDAEGSVLSDGKDATCTNCHQGLPSTTCVGYGEDNGRDYLCTQP